MEKIPPENPKIIEKSEEELYFETLKAKRDVLSSHRTMNQLRTSINRRIEEISEDKFKDDSEVQQYEIVKKIYDRDRESLAASLEKLNENDRQKILELTSLNKVEAALSLLEKQPEIETNSDKLTLEEIEEKIAFAEGQILGLKGESIEYWKSKKAELINQEIGYSINKGRPLDLAYWEDKNKELKKSIETKPESAEEIQEEITVEAEGPKIEAEEGLKEEKKEPEKLAEEPATEEKPLIAIEQKDAVDGFIEQGKGPTEVILGLARKENIDEGAINSAVDKALEESVVLKDYEKTNPQGKTFLRKIRYRIKNKAMIYVAVGLLALMAWKTDTYEHVTKIPNMAVRVMDKVPDMGVVTELPGMVASEAGRYKVMPYLVARFIGSDDYFDLEAAKAANSVGLKDTAENMYAETLSDYINNFPETRQNNRFTTLDKHTVRNYIDAFVQIHATPEKSESGPEVYKKLSGFLKENFGAAKAYELALKTSSEKNISPELANLAKKDLREQGTILTKAAGKSDIYFNQEEAVFNVIHNGHLIDTYASRAGFMNVPKDASPSFKSMGYGRTPDGKFKISSIEYGYSTLRWRDSFLPYGAEIRVGGSGEIEYQYRGQWYPATGPEATYFDQGNKIQPNKSEKDLKYLRERSRGESPLTRLNFFTADGLIQRWDKNPFGPLSYKLAGQAELIHSNPTDSDNILHPSHGCIRLDKEDAQVLKVYVGAGVSTIRISSESGGSWKSKS